jgi:hypothetical protein
MNIPDETSFASLSAAAALTSYYWLRYDSSRATTVHYKTSKEDTSFKFVAGVVYGVRELRDGMDEILVQDGTKFKIDRKTCDKLIVKSEERKGRTPPKIQDAAAKKPVVKAKPPVVAPKERTLRVVNVMPVDTGLKQAVALLSRAGIKFKDFDLMAVPRRIAQLKAASAFLADDAEGIRVLAALKARATKACDLRFSKALDAFAFDKQTTLKLIRTPTSAEKPKARITVIQQPANGSPVRLRLSDVDMPEVDDFTDDSLPSEFQRFTRSESKVVKLRKPT